MFNEFDQHAAKSFRVEKGHLGVTGARPFTALNTLRSGSFGPGQGCLQVIDGQCHVVQSLSVSVNPRSDLGIGALGLDQFEMCRSENEESDPDSPVRQVFHPLQGHLEAIPEQTNGLIQILHDNCDVIEFRQEHIPGTRTGYSAGPWAIARSGARGIERASRRRRRLATTKPDISA